MALAVHAITQRLWRLVVMTALTNHLTSKGSEHTWPALNSKRRLSSAFTAERFTRFVIVLILGNQYLSRLLWPYLLLPYTGFRFRRTRLSARTTTAATSNK